MASVIPATRLRPRTAATTRGGVSALTTVRPHEMARFGDVENSVKQHRFSPTGNQARPKLAQDRVVEAGIGERESQRILPINPASHGIRRLSIRQTLGELWQGDERQAPWRRG
ncbi:hypothetical protein [Mesorhizobium sp. LNJC394B00]|uniref:hypothetical protein n=1 Tax=Mesorhizobium sp. LNJC394B00 TaxID=1287274 RepID=UPI0003CF3025|nr:hypothetical protein [Mesorhizobium sp. LNJC394B00]ESY15427.1 hypothetical protein X750_28810 [Mesorhizobium sp. LNJC394B00]